MINTYFFPLQNSSFVCDERIDISVYKNSLLQGFSAIIPNLLLPLFVDKVGFRFFAGMLSLLMRIIMYNIASKLISQKF